MNNIQPQEPYVRPVLVRHGSLTEITFACPDWQCSVTVPDPPQES